jgi:YihY family inner membrane protein
MNIIQKTIHRIDSLQQNHRLPGFIYAVIKKYGDDQAGYQAALLTYYGFLSLFPLLLVLTTLTTLLAGNHPELQDTVIKSVTDYFPVLGNQLSEHVGGLHKSGVALAAGILFTLYGARGVADAFRHGVNHIWHVPIVKRDGFPKSIWKSLSIILVGGLGLILASVMAGLAVHAGNGFGFRVLSILLNLAILFAVFVLLLKLSLPNKVRVKQVGSGAATAAIGLVILQALGNYLLARQLKDLDALYSNFAIPLGLLFWIYLQAQVMYYAVEIAAVRSQKLWPRSLTGKPLTASDRRNYARQAAKEQAVEQETVTTDFKS